MGPDWLRTFEGVEPMGRGRAKAKQVKVARQLKYKSDDTDLDRLRAELGVGADSGDGDSAAGDYDDEKTTTTTNLPGTLQTPGKTPRTPGRADRDQDPTPRPSSTCLPRSSSATGTGYCPSKQARHSRPSGSVVASMSPASDT